MEELILRIALAAGANIFQYTASTTGSVLENIAPALLGVYFTLYIIHYTSVRSKSEIGLTMPFAVITAMLYRPTDHPTPQPCLFPPHPNCPPSYPRGIALG